VVRSSSSRDVIHQRADRFARITGMRALRIVGVSAGAAAALGLASAAYQAAGEARDRRRHPPPGHLVDVGGYRLHAVCAGRGSPAVVIIPALGATAAEWAEVQQSLARETTVCVYDRAGLGWSDSPPRRRAGQAMGEELHALLRGLGIGPPYVRVGHSLGGVLARIFIQLYPGEVIGLALIDSSHSGQEQRLPRAYLESYLAGRLLLVACAWMSPLGLSRMARDRRLLKPSGDGWASHRRADAAELLAAGRIRREVPGGDLGDLPLAVVTSSELAPGVPPGSRAQRARSRFYPPWTVLQDELAALSASSTHVVAEHAGHHLNQDDPELVTREVTGLVMRTRLRMQ
jgi:pimeloyl-ACP methyl ester carboxylesterase